MLLHIIQLEKLYFANLFIDFKI